MASCESVSTTLEIARPNTSTPNTNESDVGAISISKLHSSAEKDTYFAQAIQVRDTYNNTDYEDVYSNSKISVGLDVRTGYNLGTRRANLPQELDVDIVVSDYDTAPGACPTDFYQEKPDDSVFVYDEATLSGNYQITGGCFHVKSCAPGYTEIDNGTTPITYKPQNFSCYKTEDKYYDVTITPVIKQSLEIDDDGFLWPKWSLGFEISAPALLDREDVFVDFFPVWDDLTYKNDAATAINRYLENSITLLGKTQFDKDTTLQWINENDEVDKVCWEDSNTPECKAKGDAFDDKWPEAPLGVSPSYFDEADLDTGTYLMWYYDQVVGGHQFGTGLFANWKLHEVAITFTLPEYRTDVANQICDWIKNSSSILTIKDASGSYTPPTIISAEDIKWGDCKVETEDFPHVASSGTTPCDKADSIFYMDEDIENGRYETLKPGYCKEIYAMHNKQWNSSGEPVYESIGTTKACCTKASMDSEYTRYVVANNDYPYDVNDKKTIGCGMTCSSNYALPILKLFIGSVNTAYTYEIKDVSYNPEVQPYDRIGITYHFMKDPVKGGQPYKTEIVDDTHNHGLSPGKYTLTITTTGIHSYNEKTGNHSLQQCSGKVEKTIDIVITGQNEYEYLYISPEKCLANGHMSQ